MSTDHPMSIVWNTLTGYSDESMRFGSHLEAVEYIADQGENASDYAIREEW